MDENSIYTGSETIFFVDDESYIVDVGKEMLEDFGYCVDTMTSSARALEQFAADPLRYDLVITDFTMPEISGEAFIQGIQEIRPTIPIILCTGIKPEPDLFERIQVSQIFIKPFDMEDLLTTVRKVLDSQTPGE